MTGRKSLTEIRAELEAALGTAPAGDSEVAESLRRFIAAGESAAATSGSSKAGHKKPLKRSAASKDMPTE